MGDLGLAGSFGAAGAAEGLDEVLARRIAAKHYADVLQQQAIENAFKARQLDQTDALRRDTLAETTRQHDLQDEEKRIGFANTLGDQLPANTALAPTDPAVGMLRAGGRGSLLKHQDANLPSTQNSEVLGLGNKAPLPTGGFLRTKSAGNPEQYIKQASAKQADTEADNARQLAASTAGVDAKVQQLQQAAERLQMQGRLTEAGIALKQAQMEASRAKTAEGPKLPQREDDTVVSIHQMSPLVDELLQKTQARIAAKPPAHGGVMGTLGGLPEKAGRLMTKAAYSAGLPVAPADSERMQLASLLQVLGTVPYLRGIRNMQFVNQIQQHLADPTATDESLVERLQTLKRILPGMEQAIYDVHNKGVIPHEHGPSMGGGGATQEYDYVPGKGLVPRVK